MTGHASTSRVPVRLVTGPLDVPCRIWQGCVDHQGYAIATRNRRHVRMHREVWDAEHGAESRRGRVIHHLCENKLCLEIEHMELVTRAEHVRIHQLWRLSPLSNPDLRGPRVA